MSAWQRTLLLVASDVLAINLASVAFLWTKLIGGGLPSVETAWRRLHGGAAGAGHPPFLFALQHYLFDAIPAICACWLLLFFFFGLYRSARSRSRFDETVAVAKVVTLGTLLFIVATIEPGSPFTMTRALVASYWLSLIGLVAGGRFAVKSLERQLLVRGIGRRRTLIVGVQPRSARLLQDLRHAPAQGFDVVGFVRTRSDPPADAVADVPVVGTVTELPSLVAQHRVRNVLIALPPNSQQEILDIIQTAEGLPVEFGITPDLYDIVAGHVRTQQIHGVPLMELRRELMPVWEQAIKRGIDIAVALIVLIGFAPLWLVAALAIKLTSPGPVLLRQERVGLGGRTFVMYKFRSMYADAEDRTGPVWVRGEDPRITPVGRVLRALHLDEVPQCINFLRGDMSLVGPRPERPFFVERFRRQIPFYMRRFNVKPGLLGWAQSRHEFDLNSDDLVGIARERLAYDLYYIENLSLALDLKIMFQTIWFVLSGRSTR